MVEDSIQFCSVDHTFGPTKVREHFPERVLTLGKNMLLEVNSLIVLCRFFLKGLFMSSKRSHEFLMRTHTTGTFTLNLDYHEKFSLN